MCHASNFRLRCRPNADTFGQGLRRIDAHGLRSFQRQHGRCRVDADDDIDVVSFLELLGQAAAPEGPEARDEDPHAAYPDHTLRRDRNMSYNACWICSRMRSASSTTRPRE